MNNSWLHIIGSTGEDDHGPDSFLSAYHVGLDIVLGLRLSGEIFGIALQCIEIFAFGICLFSVSTAIDPCVLTGGLQVPISSPGAIHLVR